MKKIALLSLLSGVLAVLTGCETTGLRTDTLEDSFTPGVHAQTSVRRYDAAGNPVVENVKSEPAYLYDSEQRKIQGAN